MQAFTDLVGTAVVPAHCFDSTELTDLTPALVANTDAHDIAAEASEASKSGDGMSWCFACVANAVRPTTEA